MQYQYIDRITPLELEEGLKKAYGILTVDEFWDVRGIIATDNDYCYATKDRSCFYIYQTKEDNFAYFAIENKVQNIRGMYESIYDLVYNGFPYIHFNGRKGRYDIIKKAFHHVMWDKRFKETDNWDYLVCYIAFPENILRLINRINRG